MCGKTRKSEKYFEDKKFICSLSCSDCFSVHLPSIRVLSSDLKDQRQGMCWICYGADKWQHYSFDELWKLAEEWSRLAPKRHKNTAGSESSYRKILFLIQHILLISTSGDCCLMKSTVNAIEFKLFSFSNGYIRYSFWKIFFSQVM